MTNWVDFTGDQENGVFISVWLLKQIVDNTTNIYERINVLQSLAGGITPVGAIMLWSGTLASIPQGFQLADGTNGTPDLRGRFLMGIAATENDNNLLEAGGDTQHIHAMGTLSNATKHKHTVYMNTSYHAFNASTASYDRDVAATVHGHDWSAETKLADEHTHTGTYAAADNLPPYTRFYWIARIPA